MAKLRLPVDFDRPVSVEQDIPSRVNSTLVRYSVGIPFGGTDPTTLGPDPTSAWEIEAVHIDLTTTAAVGNRNLYYYAVDRYGNSMRYLIASTVASSRLYFVATPHAGIGTMVTGNVATVVGPSMVTRLDYLCGVGAYLDNFDGTDICVMQILVRERSQVN